MLLYFLYTGRTDWIFWALMAFGGFLFPMGLLAVIMFDSFSALNPVIIIGSIFSAFLSYLGLILLLGVLVFSVRYLVPVYAVMMSGGNIFLVIGVFLIYGSGIADFYLFMVIAMGIGLGADQQIPTAVAVCALVALLIATQLLTRRTQKRNLYLNIQVAEEGESNTFAAVNDILVKHAQFVDMRRLDHRDQLLQLTYFVDCKDQEALVTLMDELKVRMPACSFSFIDQSGAPG